MGFEVFDQKRRHGSDMPMISLLKGMNFGVNRACFERFFKGFKYVELFFNKDDKIIGFKPIMEETSRSYLIINSKGRNTGYISGVSFLKYINITPKISKAYEAKFDDKEGLVVIDLKTEGESTGSND